MFRHFLWDMAGKISGYVISLVTSIILSRLLLPDDFGVLALAQIFALIVAVVMEMGLSSAIIQRAELTREEIDVVFTLNILIVGVLTIVLFFASSFVGDFYKNESVEVAIRIICLQLVFSGLAVVPTALLYREQRFRAIMAASTVSAFGGSVVAVALALNGFGFYSLVFQSVVTAFLQYLFLRRMVSSRPRLSFQFSKAKGLVSFSAKIFLSTVLNQVFQKIDVLIFGRTYPMATLGYYNRAMGLDNILRGFSSSSILNVLLPQISRMQKDHVAVKALYQKALHLLCFSFFLVAGVMFLFSKEIIVLLFGQKWVESEVLLRLILLSSFAYPISSLMLAVIEGSGHANLFLKLEVIKKIMAVPFLVLPFFLSLRDYLACLVILSYINVIINAVGLTRVSDIRLFDTIRVILFYNVAIAISVAVPLWGLNKLDLNIFLSILIGLGMVVGLYFLVNRVFSTKGLTYFVSDLLGKFVNKNLNSKFVR